MKYTKKDLEVLKKKGFKLSSTGTPYKPKKTSDYLNFINANKKWKRQEAARKSEVSSFPVRINVKPLSVNQAWKGRRYRSDHYKHYTKIVNRLLPDRLDIPEGYLEILFIWGMSNFLSDVDNPIKPIQDLIATKYGFNDNKFIKETVGKVKTEKGSEFIYFEIKPCKLDIWNDYLM